MTAETATLIAAGVAAVAAIIAAGVSTYTAYYQATRSSKLRLAEFRREWIENLRIRIATFSTLAGSQNSTSEEIENGEPRKAKNDLLTITKDLRIKLLEEFYYIKLCLNLEEEDHKSLFELMDLLVRNEEGIQEEIAKRGYTLTEKASDVL